MAGVALVARLAVAAWAGASFPPTADGAYYAVLARRLAEGRGYTWAWPDGAVTYAAHYPVGYPALVAALYVVFGVVPWLAMLLDASLGAAAAVAVHALLRQKASSPVRTRRRTRACFGALAFALHPALVPYAAAFMTEGVTASLLAIAFGLAARANRRARFVAAAGVVMGVATLVRPQSLVLAPVVGALASVDLGGRLGALTSTPPRARATAAVFATALALLVCAPWTARNCARMGQCALVSVNGGWNLAIGTQTTNGAWQEIAVPPACRDVFHEAAKDACFGREALLAIRAAPLAWLARAPAKLHATFDYFGAAPWYLHASNAARFPYGAKVALGAVETVVSRALLVGALVAAARHDGPRRRARRLVAGAGVVSCVALGALAALGFGGAFGPLAPLLGAGGAGAYLALALALALLGARRLASSPVAASALAVIVATAATHAVFFGAGRYGLVVVPFVTALAFAVGRSVPPAEP